MEGLVIKPSEGYFRTVELSWQIAAIRDYDGDGRADIFWRRGQDQQPSREYVYLGDMPVGVFLSGSPIPHYIHVDHLNTPRLVADSAGTTVWKWDQQEPFGNNVPDENPSGLGAFDLPLRLPGQYFDKETSLHYNLHRTYDPGVGRYVEPDPLGLVLGMGNRLQSPDPTSTYLRSIEPFIGIRLGLNQLYPYALSNPVVKSDPLGLLGFGEGIIIIPPKVPQRAIPPQNLPYSPSCGPANCDQYPLGSLLREICISSGDDPNTNCVRDCLRRRYPGSITPSWLVDDHYRCWAECQWGPFAPF